MRSSALTFAALAASVSGKAITFPKCAAGLKNPHQSTSANGSATCITGIISVNASATNYKFNFAIPPDQETVTQTIASLLTAGSTFSEDIMAGYENISGIYDINTKICYPPTGINPKAVQFLTHGVGFGLGYWDFAPGYSYVDAAATAGYTTFLYDRLGVGNSSKPDPLKIVQAPLQVSIAHALIQMLKTGSIASTKFESVIGVGHSFGSEITEAITVQYPNDLVAAILTGYATGQSGLPTFLTSLDVQIASQNSPKFAGLNNGYIVTANSLGNQFAFLKSPGFPSVNLALVEASKETLTFGELFSQAKLVQNATDFKGIVDVVNGDSDWPFCMGNCTYPTDLSASVENLYPAAKAFETYLAPIAGHGLNAHYSAEGAFEQVQGFLKRNGLQIDG
ncbi:putative glucan 1-3-beta-glucosidase D [Venturia nashicola]|uniref:Putative glucan 1-3-beta-glucosidase D n=1 Tax=Venturia nashicola TaxID=86259 RepID=A0A4Z1PFX9_9PEZI|nr:putative glucan 1-3-beta-glucosidase D [Venturia nashicola]TLD32516.1 putative glucan 1-3-beta-glucosidase D [Venturia nashicola]